MKKESTAANTVLFEVSHDPSAFSLGYHSQILHLPHGRTFHCLQDIPLCSSHTEHREQEGRSRDDNHREKGGGQMTVRHQNVQLLDYTNFLALPLARIHSVIKSSFVLFPHPSPSQLISHLMDALVIKTIIVIL